MTTATPGSSGDAAPDALQATLRVEPHPDAGCALLAAGERGESVVRNEVSDGCDDRRCRSAVTVTDGDDARRELVDAPIREHCVCPAFGEVDCAAEIDEFPTECPECGGSEFERVVDAEGSDEETLVDEMAKLSRPLNPVAPA